jgi:hypothetical protein
MRLCNRCRELGRICAVCAALFAGAPGAHDLHTHEDQKQGPPREMRSVTVSTTASTTATTDWIVLPGTLKWFRIIPLST